MTKYIIDVKYSNQSKCCIFCGQATFSSLGFEKFVSEDGKWLLHAKVWIRFQLTRDHLHFLKRVWKRSVSVLRKALALTLSAKGYNSWAQQVLERLPLLWKYAHPPAFRGRESDPQRGWRHFPLILETEIAGKSRDVAVISISELLPQALNGENFTCSSQCLSSCVRWYEK